MKCVQCSKEFVPTRSDAKFDTDKCRIAFNRNKQSSKDTPDVTDNDTDNFVPNWKKLRIKKEDVATYMLSALAQNPRLEGEVFHIKGMSFQIKNKKVVRIA